MTLHSFDRYLWSTSEMPVILLSLRVQDVIERDKVQVLQKLTCEWDGQQIAK